jgi:arabinosaccharide transport system permease protein
MRRRKVSAQKIAPYFFVLPFLISFCVFYLFPAVMTVIMSFQELLPGEVQFIGLENYERLLNPHFRNSIIVSTIYTVLTIAILVTVPILLAVLVNSKITPAKNIFRAGFFVPSLVSVICAGVIFRLIFGTMDTAFVNAVLRSLGFEAQRWTTGGFVHAQVIMVSVAVWRWMGINMLYFLSGLQTIPSELYESAEMDGANAVTRFSRITLPLLKPIIIFVITISVYGGYAMFAESYIYWSNLQPPNDIGLTILRYIYWTAFSLNEMGHASAAGLVLLLIVLTINILQLNIFGVFRKEA